ncbi:MAG: GNAT family N-acetyltransferase [Erysipelotrichaceae bacterium]|nr:GNAT family N-acetyltransferase [Erysipelotrichaceae bacterium]
MDIEKIIEDVKKKNTLNREAYVALFLDDYQNICFGLAVKLRNCISINVYDASKNCLGYIHFSKFTDSVTCLDVIYTYHDNRGQGIGKQMNNLMNYFLKEDTCKFIYGSYDPQQLSDDKKNGIFCSTEELESRARYFYEKNGFKIVDYDEFYNNSNKYKELKDDLIKPLVNFGVDEKIIFKKFDREKDYGYKKCGDLLIHESLSMLNDKNLEKDIIKISR